MRTIITSVITIMAMLLVSAAISDANDTICACKNKGSGTLRLVDCPGTCRSFEELISWNVQGSQGVQGPQGPQGPEGPQGTPGECDCPNAPILEDSNFQFIGRMIGMRYPGTADFLSDRGYIATVDLSTGRTGADNYFPGLLFTSTDCSGQPYVFIGYRATTQVLFYHRREDEFPQLNLWYATLYASVNEFASYETVDDGCSELSPPETYRARYAFPNDPATTHIESSYPGPIWIK